MANLSKVFQELSEKLGMSVDEIAEAFGKKQAQAPSVPVGSGKNLKALQQAKVGARDLNEPRLYPKNITQDELAARDNFKLVGEPQTKDFTMVPEGTEVPTVFKGTSATSGAPQPTTLPVSVSPIIDDISGSSLAKVADDIDAPKIGYNKNADIPDAEIIDKVNKMPEGPLKTAALKKLGLLGLGAAGVAGGLSLLSDDDKSPSSDFSPVKIKGMPNQKSLPSGEKESATQKEQGVPVESLGEELKSEQTREPSSDRLPYMDMMQNAQQAASQNRLQAALLKAGMQAGAAIAGPDVKADYTAAEALAESAGIPVSDVKGLMETEAGAKKLKQLEEEMTDEAKMRDPNSEISKMIASAAIKAGLIKSGTKISAATLNKSGLNLTAILNAQESARNRAATIELNRQNKLFDAEKTRREKLEDLERKYEEQKKEKVAPLEASRLNLKRNLDEYIKLVDSSQGGVGTGELFGPAQKRMVDLQTQIATDMAKMADPTSSAMQGEVEKYRAGLPDIGTFVPETEATALAVLKKQLADVDKRALAGYVARGIKPDPTLYKSQSTDLTTKTVSPETQEKLINHVMKQNNVDRATAIKALKKAEKL
jgi:NACalpha-BTF3-like transcription factor